MLKSTHIAAVSSVNDVISTTSEPEPSAIRSRGGMDGVTTIHMTNTHKLYAHVQIACLYHTVPQVLAMVRSMMTITPTRPI